MMMQKYRFSLKWPNDSLRMWFLTPLFSFFSSLFRSDFVPIPFRFVPITPSIFLSRSDSFRLFEEGDFVPYLCIIESNQPCASDGALWHVVTNWGKQTLSIHSQYTGSKGGVSINLIELYWCPVKKRGFLICGSCRDAACSVRFYIGHCGFEADAARSVPTGRDKKNMCHLRMGNVF